MIYSLDGTLTYFDQNFAVVSCGGVGFKCFTTLTTLQSLPGVGKPVQLFTPFQPLLLLQNGAVWRASEAGAGGWIHRPARRHQRLG